MNKSIYFAILMVFSFPLIASSQQLNEQEMHDSVEELSEVIGSILELEAEVAMQSSQEPRVQPVLYCNVKCKDGSGAHLVKGYLTCLDLCRLYCGGALECRQVSLAGTISAE